MNKNTMCIKFITCVFMLLLLNCKFKEEHQVKEKGVIVIDLFREKVSFKNEINIANQIQLESSDAALYGEIGKLIALDSFLYILDSKPSNLKLYQFTADGQFIQKSKNGKGPGELLYPIDVFFDESQNSLWVWDLMFNRFSVFDDEFNFKNSFSIETDVPVSNLAKLENNDWLIHKPTAPDSEGGTFFYYGITVESSFKDKKQLFAEMPSDYYSMGIKNPISKKYVDCIKVVSPVGSKIYGVKDDNFQLMYSFDFKNLNITEEEFKSRTMYDLINMGVVGTKVFGISNVVETEEYLGFSFVWKKEREYVILNKANYEYITSLEMTDLGWLPEGDLETIDAHGNFVLVSNPEEYLDWSKNKTNTDTLAAKLYNNDILTSFSIK